MSIVISKFHFFQVKREVFFRYAMELNKSFFRITPEAFKSINVHFTRGKHLTMINPQMSIATKHKRIVAFKFIGIYDRAASDSLHSHSKDRFCSNILNDINLTPPVSLQNTEYRDFIIGAPSPFALTSTTKICLIKLYLTMKKFLGILIACYDGLSHNTYRLMHRWITKLYLLGYLSCREFKFKKLYYPQPFLKRYFNLVYPSVTKVVKRISTPFTTVFFTSNPIYLTSRTSCTKNKAIFPTVFFEKQ